MANASSPNPTDDDVSITVSVSAKRLDAHVARLTKSAAIGVRITRTIAIRNVLERGFGAAERDEGRAR
jgi:hypothetical protein